MTVTTQTLGYGAEISLLGMAERDTKGRKGLEWPSFLAETRTGPALHSLAMCEDGTTDRADPSLLLELVAEMGDEGAFRSAISRLSWDSVTAVAVARYVRLALKAGAHLTARHLAERGAQLFPDNTELKRMAAVLAPPITKQRGEAQDRALTANRQWLRKHRLLFLSKWVALRNGQVLAAAESLAELQQLLGKPTHLSNDMLITRVD